MNATVASSQGAASKSSCRASPACRERAVRLAEAAELVGGPVGCVHRCGRLLEAPMAEANGLPPRPTGRQSSSTCFLAAVRQGHAIERGGGDRVARRRELDADGAIAQQR